MTDEEHEDLYNRFSVSFHKLHIYELKERIKQLEDEWADQENELIDLEEELAKAHKRIKELEAMVNPAPKPQKSGNVR